MSVLRTFQIPAKKSIVINYLVWIFILSVLLSTEPENDVLIDEVLKIL